MIKHKCNTGSTTGAGSISCVQMLNTVQLIVCLWQEQNARCLYLSIWDFHIEISCVTENGR